MESNTQYQYQEEIKLFSIPFLNNENNKIEKKLKIIRGTFLSIVLIVLFLNAIYGFALVQVKVDCIEDSTFKLTNHINNYFLKEEYLKNIMILITSLFLDLLVFLFGLFWFFKGQSWRPIIAIFKFYLLRIIANNVFFTNIPAGYLWNYPGFPSIIVSYHKTNSFFFSCNIGISIIAGVEFSKIGWKFTSFLYYSASVLEAFVLILLRSHYIIDIIAQPPVNHLVAAF